MYSPGFESELHLNLPARHVAMLTFLHLDLTVLRNRQFLDDCSKRNDLVVIEMRRSLSDTLSITICGNSPPERSVYQADVISVKFFAYWGQWRGTGFRLLYSFHSQGQTPERFASGMWNCSVGSWSSIKDHFPCDLVKECVGGEDEQDCPYSSSQCEPGQFILGHSCYTYVKAREALSWNSASAQCQIRGGQLVSLNGVTEWRKFTNMLQQFGVVRVYTGLRSASLALPQW